MEWMRAFFSALALLSCAFVQPAAAALDDDGALAEVNRVRAGLGIDVEEISSFTRHRVSWGRPAMEIEGWERTEQGDRWPLDQATFDVWSGRLSKYVNFTNASRRLAGEAIVAMGAISSRADRYLGLLFPKHDLSLEGIERFRVSGRESVYYELRYSPQPQEVPFFTPLVRILINATTGDLYRYELAADYLNARGYPATFLSAEAAARIAGIFLRGTDLGRYLDRGTRVEAILPADLYYVRPNGWLDAPVPTGGSARAAWVVPFRTDGAAEGLPHLLFMDAMTGKALGGVAAGTAP